MEQGHPEGEVVLLEEVALSLAREVRVLFPVLFAAMGVVSVLPEGESRAVFPEWEFRLAVEPVEADWE